MPVYSSVVPPVPLYSRSIFTHIFASPSFSKFSSQTLPSNDVGGFPGTLPAFVDAESGQTISRAQLRDLALAFAYGVRNHPRLIVPTAGNVGTPLGRGDTVLMFSPNSIAWPVVFFGSVAAGLRVTLANSGYTKTELAWQWADSRARVVFVAEELVGVVREMFKHLGVTREEAERRIVIIKDGWLDAAGKGVEIIGKALVRMEELLGLGRVTEEEKFAGKEADETVLLCYSSGTTGKPKGVETTHRNLTSVLDMSRTLLPELEIGRDVILGILPFYHIFGAVLIMHYALMQGLPVIVQKRFEPESFCANVQKYKVTFCFVVPPVLVVLARHPVVDKYDLSSLRLMCSGAAPLGGPLTKQVRARLLANSKGKGEGCTIVQGYGLTETSPTTHFVPVVNAVTKVGSIGELLPNLEARILVSDREDGDDVDAKEGEPGELWVRGPSIMKGYLNNPHATAASITPDGWFKTGDIARRDKEGYYWIVDRKKELIKYKGFQVPPAELESLLLTHPDIADAAVIGVESVQEATELPRAYVVHAAPDRVQTEAQKAAFGTSVSRWVQGKVANHKFLRGGVILIDAVPKSAAGKIIRRQLRERAKEEVVVGAKL